MSAVIDIEVAYASADKQQLVALTLPAGSTVEQAISASGLLAAFPEIDLSKQKVGIFGRACSLTTPLHDHDRVEIYRPLLADPKESRRARVDEKRARTGRLRGA